MGEIKKTGGFDFLQRNQAEIAKTVEQIFVKAANDSRRREELERFANSISNPGVRSALLTAIRWFSAMQYREREKAQQQKATGATK